MGARHINQDNRAGENMTRRILRRLDALERRASSLRPTLHQATMSGVTVGAALLTIGTVSIPAKLMDGIVVVNVAAEIVQTAAADLWYVTTWLNGVQQSQFTYSAGATSVRSFAFGVHMVVGGSIAASTIEVKIQRVIGAGTITITNDALRSYAHATWVQL